MGRGKHRTEPAPAVVEPTAVVSLEDRLWGEYRQARADYGTDDTRTWDAFFGWMEVALPWTTSPGSDG